MNLNDHKAKKPFNQEHILKLQDYTTNESSQVVSLSQDIKSKSKQGDWSPILNNLSLGVIFSKSSVHTRIIDS